MSTNTVKDTAKCADCGLVWGLADVDEIRDLYDRVAPGEPMPAGQCKKCGALCHPSGEPVGLESIARSIWTPGEVRYWTKGYQFEDGGAIADTFSQVLIAARIHADVVFDDVPGADGWSCLGVELPNPVCGAKDESGDEYDAFIASLVEAAGEIRDIAENGRPIFSVRADGEAEWLGAAGLELDCYRTLEGARERLKDEVEALIESHLRPDMGEPLTLRQRPLDKQIQSDGDNEGVLVYMVNEDDEDEVDNVAYYYIKPLRLKD